MAVPSDHEITQMLDTQRALVDEFREQRRLIAAVPFGSISREIGGQCIDCAYWVDLPRGDGWKRCAHNERATDAIRMESVTMIYTSPVFGCVQFRARDAR